MLEKKSFLFPAIFAFLVCAAVLSFGLSRLTAYGQNSGADASVQNITRIDKSERPNTAPAEIVSNAPAISPAAIAENIRLKGSLAWAFGGKAQRGWYLYVSLIRETIQTEAAPETEEFARAVAAWQSASGIAQTGVIDETTLFQMIKGWQAQRLNSSRTPVPERLLDAPISNFYDPTRGADLLKVERETFDAYKRMVAEAAKELKLKTTPGGELAPEEKFLKIVSSYRSREHQERLRAASPDSGRAGLAVNSPHFTGNALDIYVGGEPVSTADANRAIQVETPAYKWLVKNAARFGFRPYYYEPWHWEYVPRNSAK
ncbi:MAG TPA: D-alanyl-D-alanine carboxypeptidase family protein [Pyrinomonadaceae bacterium]|nr:D-alanyl-D-alanine carboxypeptidase family protein [Pyrinomonadaceae bacterium]